jgi:hypothetical protein
MMVRHLAAAAALGLFMTCAGAAMTPARFYVATNGNDSNPGTKKAPFRSVEHARDAVRKVSRDMKADVVVEIAGGTYRLPRTLSFGPEDSGNGGHKVVYRAAGGAKVVLSGGRVVTGWTADAGGRFKARVDIPNFRQLWVNGKRAPRARGAVPAGLKPWGKHEWTLHPTPLPAIPDTKLDPSFVVGSVEVTAPCGYTTTDATLAGWGNPADIEFGYYNSWTHMICRVASIAREGDGATITMAEPGFLLASKKGGTLAGMPDYMENALELLDQPGEWYFDRVAHVLYYMPRPGEDMSKAEVVAPALTTLMLVKGTLDQPVHDVRFEGLTFSHATWLRPSELGHPDAQANFIEPPDNTYERPENEHGFVPVNGEHSKSPANVVLDAAKGVEIADCTFTALGSAGLDVQDGAQDNAVTGCIFTDISGSGMQIGDVTREDHHPSDPRRTVRGNRVTNNVITRCGVEYQDSIGVWCGYTDGTVIAHNEIFDLPYTGVSVGWGWGEPDAGGGGYTSPLTWLTPTVCGNNLIENNHIHHCMRLRNDGGGIYTLSRQPGTILRGNHIHDVGPGQPGGIYCDEGSADIEVTGNLVYAVGRPMNYNDYAQGRNTSIREHDNLFGGLQIAKGLRGKALHGAVGSVVEVPTKPELDAPQLTVEAWVKIKAYPNDWDPRRWAVCKAAHEFTEGNYSLCIDRNQVRVYVNIGGGQENCFTAVSTDGPMKLDTWQHIAMTYDGDVLRAFCDGRQVAETKVGRPRTVTGSPVTIGGRSDGYSYFGGDIDEVRIYSRALSVDEVRHNFEAVRDDKAVSGDGLAGYWNFDDLSVGDQPARDAIIAAAGLEPAYRHLLDGIETAH